SGLASIQIVTNDQGNSGPGGPKSDTSAVTITVNAVNDAPVLTLPAVQEFDEDTPLVISSAGSNGISFVDIDAGSNVMMMTLAASGTTALTIDPVNDAPVNTVPTTLSMNEDATLTLGSGALTIADVDAASHPVQVALSAINGTLTLAHKSNLTFLIGDGTNDT